MDIKIAKAALKVLELVQTKETQNYISVNWKTFNIKDEMIKWRQRNEGKSSL